MLYEVIDKIQINLFQVAPDKWLLRFGNKVTEVNYVGSRFLEVALAHNNTRSAIKILTSEFDVQESELQKYFIGFLKQLENLGIISILSLDNHLENNELVPLSGDSSWTQSLNVPIYIAWHMTAMCNLNCHFCYSRSRRGTLSFDESIRCAEALIEARVIEVSFGGGESLLVPYFPLIARRLTDSGMWVSFNTHGGLDIEHFLCPALEVPFSVIGISLDSANEAKHDSIRGEGIFRKVINSAKTIIHSGHTLRIVTVLTSSNANEVREIAKLALDLGAREIQFKQFKRSSLKLETIEKVELTLETKLKVWDTLQKLQSEMPEILINFGQDSDPIVNHHFGDNKLLACNCGSLSACLREDGSIAACTYSDRFLGNLLHKSLLEIWSDSSKLRSSIPSCLPS
jgi:MoaA/NifB/PqqE/SkfB family radical SAM enzyme